MDIWQPNLVESADNDARRKKLRYAAVSAASVPLGQGLIQVLGLWLGNYATASLLTAAIITVPSFLVLRVFVWRHMSREDLGTQMVVFWVSMMVAFSLATFLTYLVARAAADQPTVIRGGAVLCVQLLAFGVVWVGRYVMLDRWLFRAPAQIPSPPTILARSAPAHQDGTPRT